MKTAFLLSTLSLASLAALCYSKVDALPLETVGKNYPVLVKPRVVLVNWEEQLIQGIMKFEGFSSKPYICPAGVLTVGYGHTGKYANQSMSKSFAEKLLRTEIREARITVLRVIRVKLSDHQLAALTSFTFNCGESNLQKLVNGKNRLNSGNYRSVEEYMPLYVKADGQTLRGLKIRRVWELDLWKGIFTI